MVAVRGMPHVMAKAIFAPAFLQAVVILSRLAAPWLSRAAANQAFNATVTYRGDNRTLSRSALTEALGYMKAR